MYLDIFSHLYGLPLAAPRNDYLDEDIPDEDDTDAPLRAPASPIPSQPSHSPSSSPRPLANKSHAPPQKSIAGWDICKMTCLAGGTGLEQVIAAADDAMPPEGLLWFTKSQGQGGMKRYWSEHLEQGKSLQVLFRWNQMYLDEIRFI